jgi:hypothetical protein
MNIPPIPMTGLFQMFFERTENLEETGNADFLSTNETGFSGTAGELFDRCVGFFTKWI